MGSHGTGMETAATEEDRTRVCDLPEACVAHVIALTSPRDACRCAAVSPCFRDAAESDVVWARFLPPDYLQLHQAAALSSSTKKETYLGLTDVAVLVDGGSMAVWLAKGSGAKCVALSARRLSLPWEDGEFSWRWTPHPLSSPLRVIPFIQPHARAAHPRRRRRPPSAGTLRAAAAPAPAPIPDSAPAPASTPSIGGGGGAPQGVPPHSPLLAPERERGCRPAAGRTRAKEQPPRPARKQPPGVCLVATPFGPGARHSSSAVNTTAGVVVPPAAPSLLPHRPLRGSPSPSPPAAPPLLPHGLDVVGFCPQLILC